MHVKIVCLGLDSWQYNSLTTHVQGTAGDSYLAIKEIPLILNLAVHHHIHKILPLDHVLSQFSPASHHHNLLPLGPF